MSRHIDNEGTPSNPHRVPPFWIRPEDDRRRSVHPRVYALARRIWPWAFRHVERELHDGPSAAETLEAVAIDVSSRLQTTPEVGRNLDGYLITAFRRSVRARRARDHRIDLEGLGRELEMNHRLRAPDLGAELESRQMLDLIRMLLPKEILHTFNLRLLGFSWNEVSGVLGISPQASQIQVLLRTSKSV